MKNKMALYLIAVIAAGSVRFVAAEANGANDVKLDRAVQVYTKKRICLNGIVRKPQAAKANC